MARVTIAGDTLKVSDPYLGGDPIPALKAYFDFAKGHSTVVSRTINGISSVELDHESMTIDPILLSLSSGFTVEGAPIYLKMTPLIYVSQVPEGISNRSFMVEDQEVVRTWAEWKDSVHEHMDATDGDKIVPGNSFGYELSSAELSILLGLGFTMLLGSEVNQYRPSGEI